MNLAPGDDLIPTVDRIIPVRTWGNSEAPPLLLLHGLFGNSHEWDTVAQRLSAHRRVIVPDQRGHGAADWAREYTAADFCADVTQLVDTLQLPRFDLVGHSMGGIVSLLYAAGHVERVERLVLVDIGPESLSDDAARDGFLEMLRQCGHASYRSPREAAEQWCAADPLARAAETLRWARHGLREGPGGRWTWRVDTAGIGGFLTAAPNAEALWAAVEQIRFPALVLHGEASWALPRPDALALAKRLPYGSAVEVAGAGHDLGVQAPEAVAHHVSAFLGADRSSPVVPR
jgi:esterase